MLSNQFHTRSKVNLRNERRKVNIETSRFEIYRDGAQRTLVGTLEREKGGIIFRRAPFLRTCIELRDKNIFLSFEFCESLLLLLLLLNFRIFRIDGVEERVSKNRGTNILVRRIPF